MEILEEKVREYSKVKVFPQLYAFASTGKIKTWQIAAVEHEDLTATILTVHGYIDGKIQMTPKSVKKGKNIGKSNETTPFQQACGDARSKFNKQVDKRYIEEMPTADNQPEIYLPMLAEKITDYLHKLVFSAMAQIKLNGVRCLAKKISETEINFTSRKFKSYNSTLFHLTEHLLPLMEVGEMFDGEIYLHGWGIQKILRHVKKLRPDTHRLQFWVYDKVNDDIAEVRNQDYRDAIPAGHSHIIKVPTRIITCMDMLEDFHKRNIEAGFEGTIIRNMGAKYKFGPSRSTNLLKKKDFEDGEFIIVGREAEVISTFDGDGNQIDKNAIIFVCEVPDVGTFTARPRGSDERRVRWYDDFHNIIGKDLTVRFAEWTEDGLPFHGVGLAIRDYE